MPSYPTLDKTWQHDANISLASTGTALGDHQAIMRRLKDALIGFGSGAWTLRGSSDSCTAGLDAVDRWGTPVAATGSITTIAQADFVVPAKATGTITTVAKANLIDGETFTVSDGATSLVFEFDTDGSVTPGRVRVDISTCVSDSDVRDAIIAAVNGASFNVTASSGGAAQVDLTNDHFGANNVAITHTVADPGFAVTGMSGGVNGEHFTLNDGRHSTVSFWFDPTGTFVPPSGWSTTNVKVDISTAVTASDVRDAIIAAVNGVSSNDLQVSAASGGADLVDLTHENTSLGGCPNQTITDTVVNAGFVVSGMSGGVNELIWSSGIHSWVVLRQTGIATNFEVCIDLNNNDSRYGTVTFSRSAGFTGGTVWAAPTATDGYTLVSGSLWGTGAVSFDSALNVMLSTDGACTRAWLMVDDGTNYKVMRWIAFEKVKNPDASWTNPHISLWLDTASTASALTEQRLSRDAPALTFHSGLAFYLALTAEGDRDDYGAGDGFFSPNDIDGEWPIRPMSVTAEAGKTGRHGRIFDLWYAKAGTQATGSITTVVGLNILDGQTFTINDGVTVPAMVFEFEKAGGTVEGNIVVNITDAMTADEVRDACIAAINGSGSFVVASNGGAATVTLTHRRRGLRYNKTVTTTVTDPGFAVTGLSGSAVLGHNYPVGGTRTLMQIDEVLVPWNGAALVGGDGDTPYDGFLTAGVIDTYGQEVNTVGSDPVDQPGGILPFDPTRTAGCRAVAYDMSLHVIPGTRPAGRRSTRDAGGVGLLSLIRSAGRRNMRLTATNGLLPVTRPLGLRPAVRGARSGGRYDQGRYRIIVTLVAD